MESTITPPEPTKNNSTLKIVGFTCLGLVILLCCCAVIGGALYFITKDSGSSSAMPGIPGGPNQPAVYLRFPPVSDSAVIHEKFDNNDNNWASFYENDTDAYVSNGKLSVVSYTKDYVALGACMDCGKFNNKYYLQADLSSDQASDAYYGLAFSVGEYSSDGNNYYVFDAIPEDGSYTLHRLENGEWFTLAEDTSSYFKPYPAVNTYGMYFDNGTIELYVNGNRIGTYQDDSPLPGGYIGVYVNDTGPTVQADNVLVYPVK